MGHQASCHLRQKPQAHRGSGLLNRLLAKVEPGAAVSDCWNWHASTARGYGQICLGGRARKEGAHRVSYRLFVGPIPPGLDVCHTCDKPSCCNPRHLFVGTALDNMRDRDAKGRAAPMTPERCRAHSEFMAAWWRKNRGKYLRRQALKRRRLYLAEQRGAA